MKGGEGDEDEDDDDEEDLKMTWLLHDSNRLEKIAGIHYKWEKEREMWMSSIHISSHSSQCCEWQQTAS